MGSREVRDGSSPPARGGGGAGGQERHDAPAHATFRCSCHPPGSPPQGAPRPPPRPHGSQPRPALSGWTARCCPGGFPRGILNGSHAAIAPCGDSGSLPDQLLSALYVRLGLKLGARRAPPAGTPSGAPRCLLGDGRCSKAAAADDAVKKESREGRGKSAVPKNRNLTPEAPNPHLTPS